VAQGFLTDEQIVDTMYDHASGFTSCVQFPDDAAVIAFARDLLSQVTASPEPVQAYGGLIERFVEDVDGFLSLAKPGSQEG
jgi:hypothetical protein